MNLVGLPSQVIQEMLLIKSQRYDFPLLGCANNVFLVIPSLMAESKTTIARYRASWRAMLQPGHALSVPTHVTAVQALICFIFSFFIYSLCVPYWQQAIIIIFIIFFFFYYVFLQRNSFDTNYRRIILKSYIKYCAQKLYDKFVRKKLSEKSS